METTKNYNVCIKFACALLIVLVLAVSFDRRFTSFSSKILSQYSSSVPTVDFHGNIITTKSNPIQAVHSNDSTNYILLKNTTALTIKKSEKRSGSPRGGVVERQLARARASIHMAGSGRNLSSSQSMIYRNPAAFYRSYKEMERRFKVYVYSEGDLPIVHDGPCKDIYSIEGRFINEMEHRATRFKTRNPKLAHVYFMPFSVTWMVKYIYKPKTYDVTPLQKFAGDYVRVISTKYPFWNRTHGADHFMLACHDWGPHASRGNPHLYNTSIRVLCNANSSEGFNPTKDITLPEIMLKSGNVSPKIILPLPTNLKRNYLAFFAGGRHGPIRPILLDHWKGRDPDLPVYEYLPKDLDYYSFMLQSKFCLCPSGYEAASPRIVEAIYSECVPVILSDHYVLPFSDVLRWEAFSVQVNVSDIPMLKEVLRSVSEEKYLRLKEGVRAVRKHFEVNQPVKRFDMFHMILHSIWLRRLNIRFGLVDK